MGPHPLNKEIINLTQNVDEVIEIVIVIVNGKEIISLYQEDEIIQKNIILLQKERMLNLALGHCQESTMIGTIHPTTRMEKDILLQGIHLRGKNLILNICHYQEEKMIINKGILIQKENMMTQSILGSHIKRGTIIINHYQNPLHQK